jgi:hypothetical protein
MKKKLLLCAAAVIAIFSLAGCESWRCCCHHECCEKHEHHDKKEKQEKLLAQAKVSQADAEKTALAQVPGGTVKEAEIEKEDGKLIWSFDVVTPDSKDTTEVNIDAVTGSLVNIEKDGDKDNDKDKDQSGEHTDKD